MRKKRGFTLIEVIIVVVLVGFIMLIGGNLLSLSLRSLRDSTSEFEFQSDVRFAAGWAVSRIRFATAIFTVPEGSFRDDNLDDGWNYYGVEQTSVGSSPASRIVHYTWDPNIPPSGGHHRIEIVEPREGISFRMVFSKEKTLVGGGGVNEHLAEGDLLDFDILGYTRSNTSTPDMVVEGTTLPANAMQSVDRGTDFHEATAIAYRVDERPPAFIGHIAMVLDTSGSMDWDMDGNHPAIGDTRISILEDAATTMIRDLATQSNIDLQLIPFDSWASPKNWENIQLSLARPLTDPDNLIYQVEELDAGGGTNTGDGLRRAYFSLRDHGQAVTSGIPRRFVIVLVDGDSNVISTVPIYDLRFPTQADYYLGEGDLTYNRMYMIWVTSGLPTHWGDPAPYQLFYPSTQNLPPPPIFQPIVGENVKKWGGQLIANNFARAFVIVFSSTVSADGIKNIGDAFNTDLSQYNMFLATDPGELDAAFQAIKTSILNELWHLNGPSL